MDGDPAVELELDSFSRILPLPYRVALIIVMGTRLTVSAYLYQCAADSMAQAYGLGASTFTTSP